jgi:ribosomal protein L16 Arg81 hydroxylase
MEDFRYKRGDVLDVHPHATHYQQCDEVTYEVVMSKPMSPKGLRRGDAGIVKYVRWLRVRPSDTKRLSGWVPSTEFVRIEKQ